MTKRVRVYFTGRVQGVGFRYTTREVATGFDVTGFVKNLPDGRVELVAEGNATELEEFLKEIDASHLAPFIRNKQVDWANATGEFRSFNIAH
jgi:acylphosphatase